MISDRTLDRVIAVLATVALMLAIGLAVDAATGGTYFGERTPIPADYRER